MHRALRKVLGRGGRRQADEADQTSTTADDSYSRFTKQSGGIQSLQTDYSAVTKASTPLIRISPAARYGQPSSLGIESTNLGLKVLYQSNETTNSAVDIVFVHGLTGKSYNTWLHEQSGTHWPSQLLYKDIPEARILAFGYDADMAHFWSPASLNRVSNHAENMLGALARLRGRTDTENRNVIFIAHSLGGLVTQNALSISRASAEKHIRDVEGSTIGIIFLGTPHHGSDFAAWGIFASRLMSIAKRSNADIVAVLQPGSEMLAIIQQGFHSLLRRRKNEGSEIYITCFFEELPVKLVGEVVTKHSAIIPGYSSYGIHANHMDMTKFASNTDQGYEDITGEIYRWVKLQRQKVQPTCFGEIEEECLKALDYEELGNRQERIETALPLTFDWVFVRSHIQFSNWLQSTGGLYWISGKPGSGKSTIMKYLASSPQTIQLLGEKAVAQRGKPQSVIASFFLDFQGSSLARSVEGMLRSILYQILKQQPQLFCAVLPLFEERQHTQATFIWRRSDLESILSRVIMEANRRNLRVLLFIDALDEYQAEDIQIADFFANICGKFPDGLYVCVSSRSHVDFIHRFRNYPKLHMEDETIDDIQHYVAVQFLNVIEIEGSNLQILVDSVVENAEGVFLWVKLVCDELLRAWRKGEDLSSLTQRLREIPKELNAFYARMLDGLSTEDRLEVRAMLAMVRTATRPLSPLELRYAVHHATDLYHDLNNDRLAKSRILAVCGGFLEVRKPPVSEDETDTKSDTDAGGNENALETVHLAHQTVSTFLSAKEAGLGDEYSRGVRAAGHISLLRACIGRLLSLTEEYVPVLWELSTKARSRNTIDERFKLSSLSASSFIEYAATWWIYHAQYAERYDTHETIKILRRFPAAYFGVWLELQYETDIKANFVNPADESDLEWQQFREPLPLTLLELTITVNIFHYAANIINLSVLSNTRFDINEHGGRLLYAVARGGNMDIARLLFDFGATISPSLRNASSALARAIYFGHLSLAQLFLDRGASPDEPALYFKDLIATPLEVVIETKSIPALKLLARYKANLEGHVSIFGTALQASALRGDLAFTKALLELGANVNGAAPGSIYGGALEAAIMTSNRASRKEIIELLLCTGANPNVRVAVDQKGPLLWKTVLTGDAFAVQKLLEYGASVNEMDELGRSLLLVLIRLHAEHRVDHLDEIGRILMQHGAVFNDSDIAATGSIIYWSQDIQERESMYADALKVTRRLFLEQGHMKGAESLSEDLLIEMSSTREREDTEERNRLWATSDDGRSTLSQLTDRKRYAAWSPSGLDFRSPSTNPDDRRSSDTLLLAPTPQRPRNDGRASPVSRSGTPGAMFVSRPRSMPPL